MTGEKIRSLRKDNAPGKEEDLLEPDEEAATGTFTSSSRNNKAKSNKIFSNHKITRSASQLSNQQINSNTNNGVATQETIDDQNKNPVPRIGTDYPLHECVFNGDVRRLSSLIRTQNIAQKDSHGRTSTSYNKQ